MTEQTPMTQEQLNAIKVRADSVTTLRRAMPGDWQRLALHLSEDTETLIAEVERLRALTTVDEAMVERVARAYYDRSVEGLNESYYMQWDQLARARPGGAQRYRDLARTVLDAALNPGEGS